jgi:iron(III) transport system ATP-binding protein
MKKVSVDCRNISLSYGATQVLKDINLTIEPGEFFALLGPSGSGKSTLLRLIAGFNQKNSGELLVDGKDISQVPPWQRNIGMVFQNYALWPHMTVWDNVAFGLVERKVPRAELTQRVQAILELVSLAAYAKRYPGQLSGGQQQRVALARTIVIEPKVLLLDEPLSNLDKNLRVQMRQELLALQRRLGITTIFVTHDQEEAMTTADRMAVLHQGVVQQVGTPAELFNTPTNRFVAEFVGTMNRLPATVQDFLDDTIVVTLEDGMQCILSKHNVASAVLNVLHIGLAVSVCARPHQLSFRRSSTEQAMTGPAGLTLTGTILLKEFMGQQTRYVASVGSQSLMIDQVHQVGDATHATGAQVLIDIPTSNIKILDA